MDRSSKPRGFRPPNRRLAKLFIRLLVRQQALVVESVRESTTRGVLVVDFLPPFDNQQLFFLVRSQLPVA